jgi:hypothetical protein
MIIATGSEKIGQFLEKDLADNPIARRPGDILPY